VKNYKKALLALSIVATLPLMAATNDDYIYVNTFADEDGENSNACSLREAVQTAADNKPYGGCSVGKTSSAVTDFIMLKAGEYVLEKPLTPSSMIKIFGETPTDWSEKDILTGDYPQRTPLQTTISGNNTFTLFDTTAGKSQLSIESVRLEDGNADRGGAIKAGSLVSLVKVEIANSNANEGGAIYLSGIGSSLEASSSVFENNTASRGAVIAMSCNDKLSGTTRTITINGSSIVNNGQSSTASVIEFCGAPDITMTANTIAQNTASSTSGSIIKFTGDSVQGQGGDRILSTASDLTLLSNTIVNNTAYSTLLYDSFGTKSLDYNIIAYNSGMSCRYLLGTLPKEGRVGFSTSFNGLVTSPNSVGYCQLPYDELDDETLEAVDGFSQSTLMTTLQPASEYTAFLPMYFLKEYAQNPLINVDESSPGCQATDPRGFDRFAGNALLMDANTSNSCDIGSTELTLLSAKDLKASNTSQVQLIDDLEAEAEFFQDLLDDEDTEEKFLEYYQVRKDYFTEQAKNVKDGLRYRQAYFDIFANSIPAEIVVNGQREVKQFDSDSYTIETLPLTTTRDVFTSGNLDPLKYQGGEIPVGYSKVSVDIDNDSTTPNEDLLVDNNLGCEWRADIEALVMWRKDFTTENELPQEGDFSYCRYKIILKSDPSINSVGLAQAAFKNIAPIANNDAYTLKFGTEQRVKLDILANDSDDGDGVAGQEGFPVGKDTFYVGEDGISAPIKFGKIDSSLVIESEQRVVCPDGSREWCYGGDIHIKPRNSFNKFNYTIEYTVFDADATESNSAEIKLISTATTSDDTRGGGGSLGIFSVFGLTGLALWRRRVKH
jgi:CSLREA domain-containing protein